MNTTLRKCLLGTCFAGGMIVLSATAANAADTTSGKDGILSGSQVVAPVSAPINLNATSLGILGNSSSTASGGAHSAGTGTSPTAPAASTSGSNSIGSGTQIVAPITVPINLGSSSVGLLGGFHCDELSPTRRATVTKFDAGEHHQRQRWHRFGNPSDCTGDGSHHAGCNLGGRTGEFLSVVRVRAVDTSSSCPSTVSASGGPGSGNHVGGREYRVRRSGSGSDFGPC